MTTTAAAIRDQMITEVLTLTPATLGDTHPYRLHSDWERTVREQARAQADVVRLFSIRDTGDLRGPSVSNTDVEWVETVLEFVMAYSIKSTSRWGTAAGRDLDDVMEADLKQIEKRIGPSGYAALEGVVGDRALVFGGPDWPQRSREVDEQVTFSVLRLRVGFYRSMT